MALLSKSPNTQNWIYFTVRWVILIALCAFIFVAQNRTFAGFDSVRDLAYALAAGAVANLLFGLLAAVPALRPAAPYAGIAGDWVTAGMLVYICATDPVLVVVCAGVILISSMMRFGYAMGAVSAVGIVIASVIGLGTSPAVGFDVLRSNIEIYLPELIALTLVALVSGVWAYALDEENSRTRRRLRAEMEIQHRQMEIMRDRAAAITKMSTALTVSLDYEKVLDSALNIGRLSLRNDPNKRVVSMVLLVESEEELRIATARGVSHVDLHRTFQGRQGILARTLERGYPMIENNGENDPELGRMTAFKNIQSVLCIPLRAGYNNYGVVVYGSTEVDAFEEDLIDTLKAIGTQATIALNNASLYSTLMEEKRRIISIEENARKALVRDLHDVPTQTISAVAMRLGIIPRMLEKTPDQVVNEVEEIREMALRATTEIRHVMFTLRPLSLETQGLDKALDQLAEKMETTYGQRVTVRISPDAQHQLNSEQEGTLFYLIEEAVNNARKYAQASMIRVEMTREGSHIVVRVRDNGVGFDPSEVSAGYENRGSFGMVNMHERAELIGGHFELSSKPGSGTTVTVVVPITTSRPASLQLEDTGPPRRASRPRMRLNGRKRAPAGPISPRN